mmetsp:Transcript_18609/g.25801  ORF Transcript_18609/g.25801 Transcript_18609/m.25801 type:complete len:328 (-) Transcript_18609:52-1035(-)|eukprot:CAMPEP_0196594778 /NCGR_PEP_ID=MMETSP1081-20130531/79278_1 /TAXON_ID=36882 /ORGANISM="Pyramimonas amylifera, Strain CCMP720" /LENGTH=327 /DNA_ID=CAMNT_0041919133 /DNA_START=51 /DNA_END=1034 /DNA_ORIENTATION=-
MNLAAIATTAVVLGFSLGRRGASMQRTKTTCSASRIPPAKPVPSISNGPFKVALCQLSVSADKQSNILRADQAIRAAASQGARMVVLPEMWNCPYANDSFPVYAEDIEAGEAPSASMMSKAAEEAGVVVVGGSIPERVGDCLYNTCCVFSTQGNLLARHRKTHLFDIDIPGKVTFKESDCLTQGEQGTVVDTELGRLGIGICFDVRFPDLSAVYAARGAQMLVFPGAFNMTTGPLHWQLLHQARAVDNQVYVACCSPARNMDASYQAWGHSMLIGPFAEILASCEHECATVMAEVDFDQIVERRTNMPLEKQRRGDLYTLVDNKAQH